ncbi:hypothetical protein GCM10023183_28110 [Nibribacter koreensis]|uniref:Uncharacterized protein n=1 Tax=Nibribacter koreensis TaxID=1084519 RepID=A0ABP8FST0_9BACT
MLGRAEFRTDFTGQLRLQLERRDLPLSNTFFMDLRANTEKGYSMGVRYMGANTSR